MTPASGRTMETASFAPAVCFAPASIAAAANLPCVAVSRSGPRVRVAPNRLGTGGSALAGTLNSSERIASSSDSRFHAMGSRSSGTRNTSRDQPETTAWIGAGSGSSLPVSLFLSVFASGSPGRPFATAYAGSTVVKYAISAMCCGGKVTMRYACPAPLFASCAGAPSLPG